MATDGFRSRFGAKAPLPDLVVNHAGGVRPYESFDVKDKVVRLDIRCRDGLAHSVPYSYILNITYNRKTYGEIFLTVSGMAIVIKGRGLKPVVDAMKLHTCEFLQEFDPDEYAAPTDSTAPFIESIAVEVMRGNAPSTAKPEAAAR